MLKDVAKEGAYVALTAALAPLLGTARLHMALSADDPYERYAMALSLLPGALGWEVRRAFYRNTLRRCGRNLKLGFGSYFVSPETEVGENLHTGSYCVIGPVTIGDDVAMASHISILDGLHQHGFTDMERPILDQPGASEHVSIGSHTWIGEGARVAASVGEKSIVGVGAVVTRPVKPGAMVLGNPARVIGHRNRPLVRGGAGGGAGQA